MNIEITSFAKQEYIDAKTFYELEQTGLGRLFETEIRQAFSLMMQFPLAWGLERGSIRQHRDPDYWANRYSVGRN